MASRLAGPNDLVVGKNGGVLFHGAGAERHTRPAAAGSAAVAGGLLRAARRQGDPDRRRHRPPERHHVSPDEKTLYVNDTNGEHVLAFDIKPDGTVGNRRNFAKYPTVNKTPAGAFNSGADGLALDNAGRVYVVSLGGVHVFSPKGDLLGTIPLSLQGQNIAFAGRRQENAVHRRPRLGVQGAAAGRRVQRESEVMPIFEYICKGCGKGFELIVRSTSPPPSCPACSSTELEKQISSAGHQVGDDARPGDESRQEARQESRVRKSPRAARVRAASQRLSRLLDPAA